ncbi:MAG: hypothetical protein JWQ01_3420 [Massilia sp.]|jgi:hypothetical protein|nr:hypothetical protein [Massilia sp.]
MTTSTASLPAHGPSLIAAAVKLITAFFPAPTAKPAAGASGSTMLNLLRMSAGMNSVNPELFADRIVQD